MTNPLESIVHRTGTLLVAALAASALPAAAPGTGVGPSGVTVVTAFPANKGPGYRKPNPDAAGAVGLRHTAVLDDRAFVVHDKTTGKVLRDETQHEFWLKVLPTGTFDLNANDPRLLYDPITRRWFAWVQGLAPANGYLAVSTTPDPTQPWRGVKMPIPPHNYGARIGFDRDGLYVSVHNGSADLRTAQTCYAIPMADVVAADGPDLSNMEAFRGLEIEAFPATDPDPDKPPGAPAALLHREFGDTAGKLFLYRITWSGKKASISAAQSVPLSRTYRSPNGSSKLFQAVQPAPGLKLRADEGRRTLSVFSRGGSVFGCNVAKRAIDSRCGILWYEVRVRDGALVQEGFVDAADCDYLTPSLAVDGKGNIGLGCTRTSATEFPSVYVMMHGASDAAGTMRPPGPGGEGDHVLPEPSQREHERHRLGELLLDLPRPGGPDSVLDVSGVLRQRRRTAVVYGLGVLSPRSGQRALTRRPGSRPRT